MNKFLNKGLQTYNYWTEKFESLTQEQIKAWRTVIMVLIVVDMFGVYYYLQWKKLGFALLIVLTILLIPLIVKGKPEEKVETKKKPDDFEFPMGNSEDYNKRLDQAISFEQIGFKTPTLSPLPVS